MDLGSKQKVTKSERKFISFFSGALGLDLGLEAAGLDCIAANEIDGKACSTIRLNRPDLKLYQGDVRLYTPEILLRDLKIESGELFAIVGGPPCQAFSTAGRRLGLNDDRGNVFLHFISIIGALRPKYAVFENVRGLLSAPLLHRPHEQRGAGYPPLLQEEAPGGALLHILKLFESYGYKTTFTLYNTANFGVPQIRERLIFLACRQGEEMPFLSPTHDEFGMFGMPKWRTLKDAIWKLQHKPLRFSKFPNYRTEFYKHLREGQNWRDLPATMQEAALGKSFQSGGGKTGFYRRLSWTKPSPTLVTRPNMKATDLCHPDEIRPLAVEEYAAIQTFPEGFEFCGNLDDIYRQIGNAVPCQFGKQIGEHLIDFEEGRLTTLPHKSKLSRYAGTDHLSWRRSVEKFDADLFAPLIGREYGPE